jgi:hypothetical protein
MERDPKCAVKIWSRGHRRGVVAFGDRARGEPGLTGLNVA